MRERPGPNSRSADIVNRLSPTLRLQIDGPGLLITVVGIKAAGRQSWYA